MFCLQCSPKEGDIDENGGGEARYEVRHYYLSQIKNAENKHRARLD